MPRWRRRHHHRHHAEWADHDWRQGPPKEMWRRWYFHWRLRRRIFAWLAIAMAFSGIAVGLVIRWNIRHGEPHFSHLLLPLGLTFLVLWASAGAIAHRLARPYVELERVARAIGRGDTTARFSMRGVTGAESRIVGETINDMADRIAKQLADQRALLAAVSHEIRTPLARMRLLVELTKDAPNEKALLDLDREIVEIDQLVSELLAASRMDFSALSPRDLDAKALALTAMERAEVKKEILQADDGDFTVRGDATLLSRAMVNLLENAKRHGGGVASVRMGVRESKVFFEVDDDGEGFAKGEEDRAFEPFRKGRSSTGDDKGSVGFGLALVRRIAEAHGGRAYARNRQPRGARVGLEIARTAD